MGKRDHTVTTYRMHSCSSIHSCLSQGKLWKRPKQEQVWSCCFQYLCLKPSPISLYEHLWVNPHAFTFWRQLYEFSLFIKIFTRDTNMYGGQDQGTSQLCRINCFFHFLLLSPADTISTPTSLAPNLWSLNLLFHSPHLLWSLPLPSFLLATGHHSHRDNSSP